MTTLTDLHDIRLLYIVRIRDHYRFPILATRRTDDDAAIAAMFGSFEEGRKFDIAESAVWSVGERVHLRRGVGVGASAGFFFGEVGEGFEVFGGAASFGAAVCTAVGVGIVAIFTG